MPNESGPPGGRKVQRGHGINYFMEGFTLGAVREFARGDEPGASVPPGGSSADPRRTEAKAGKVRRT